MKSAERAIGNVCPAPAFALCACCILGAALLWGCARGPIAADAARADTGKPASIPTSRLLRKPGGFYTDDAPDSAPTLDLDKLPDPEPIAELLNASANQPYTVFGRSYFPLSAPGGYRRQGTASWYGRKFHGQRTTGGEIYDMFALSAAHPTLPIPSYARVTNLQNGRTVVVRINDRGPFASGRIMDVSYAAAHKLGFVEEALAHVEIESLAPAGLAAQIAAPAPQPKPEPEPLPQRLPIASETGGIYLQLGAFASPTNAENFSARIRRELDWLQQPLTIWGRDGLYRLHLGPFRSRAEAAAASQRIREALDMKPMLIKK